MEEVSVELTAIADELLTRRKFWTLTFKHAERDRALDLAAKVADALEGARPADALAALKVATLATLTAAIEIHAERAGMRPEEYARKLLADADDP